MDRGRLSKRCTTSDSAAGALKGSYIGLTRSTLLLVQADHSGRYFVGAPASLHQPEALCKAEIQLLHPIIVFSYKYGTDFIRAIPICQELSLTDKSEKAKSFSL